MDLVNHLNPSGELLVYPGSPKIVDFYLRQKDKMHLCELHPNDFPKLQAVFPNKRRANVECGDGFAAVKAWLPPPQKRGFILMDPPYEVKKDYQTVVTALVDGYKRFATGTYAIWYPVLNSEQVRLFLKSVADTKIRNVLLIELLIRDADTPKGMNGSGMIVVNPPWTLKQDAEDYLPVLVRLLGEDATANYRVEWITPE